MTTLEQVRQRSKPVALVALAAFLWSYGVPRNAGAAPRQDTPTQQALEHAGVQTGKVHRRPEVRLETDPKPHMSVVDAPPSGPMQPRSLPGDFANKTGVSGQAISVPSGAGTIDGMGESFSTQPSTGVATFSIPIVMPPARGGAQPSLALTYSSASGNGAAGMGWDIGVPFVARQTDRGIPRYDDGQKWNEGQDHFIFNGGQELVPICGGETSCDGKLVPEEILPDWAAGWQYFRPRVDGAYVRFFWSPSHELWRVQDKQGVVMELGVVDGDTQGIDYDPEHPNHIYRWNLRRQIDSYGNQVVYGYTRFEENGIGYLTDLWDTAPVSGLAGAASWAHHTRVHYALRTDVSVSFNRGWRTEVTRRVSQIDVTSKSNDVNENRELVRRYVLDYVPESTLHVSQLATVSLYGRCSPAAREGDDGTVAPTALCAELPAVTLSYSHVHDGVFVAGFEDFDTDVKTMTPSPDHSLDEEWTDLYDVNADGLPDVVTMMPGLFQGKHGYWINGEGGQKDAFGAVRLMGLDGDYAPDNMSVVTKKNPNIAALDIDGNGIINLVHMPIAKSYKVYEPRCTGLACSWFALPQVNTLDGLDARIDLAADADRIRVMDVNGDGLVDVVRSAGTAYQTWFALGRHEGGWGLFGHVEYGEPTTLSMEPASRCVPWAGQPVLLSDPDVAIADMNGDGLPDLVRIRENDIKYWPGRGDGTFGTGPLGCAEGTYSQNTYVAMGDSPWFSDPTGTAMRVDDVNGDGLADLVHVRFNEVDIWLNVDGTSWRDRRILTNVPVNAGHTNRVRIADMNGSGTADIVWGDGSKYRYIDLQNGTRPWLLTKIDNGFGKLTEIAYEPSTEQMRKAALSGQSWARVMPIVTHVVSSVTVRDSLYKVGRPEGVYKTEYRYRDPLFDGAQREFRGFERTEVRTPGDANSPTSIAVSEFYLGERPTKFPLDGLDYTKPERWYLANPQEALKGLPKLSETRTDTTPAVVHSSAYPSYRLRRLYPALDGRDVYTIVPEQQDTWLYDTAAPAVTGGSASIPGIEFDDRGTPANSPLHDITIASTAGARHIRSSGIVDLLGNQLLSKADGEADLDTSVVSHADWALKETVHPLGAGHWSWRAVRAWTDDGSQGAQPRRLSEVEYDDHGAPVTTTAHLDGVQPLDRAAGGAPSPARASTDHSTIVSHVAYDAFGNAVAFGSPVSDSDGRCRSVDLDDEYAQLPTSETVYAGVPGLAMPFGEVVVTCGLFPISSSAEYDRAVGAVTKVTGPNGEVSEVKYDDYGRPWRFYRPSANTPGVPSSTASRIVEYTLPSSSIPYGTIYTRELDGANDADAQYHESYVYIDSMGRTLLTLSEADPDPQHGDGFGWIASGLSEYDAKGAVRRAYVAWPVADLGQLQFAVPAGTSYTQQRYDAFGRGVESIGLDGQVAARTRYHALSVDRYDAEDIGPGPHQGTFVTQESDGHGRGVRAIVRARPTPGAAIELTTTETSYLVTGEPVAITSKHGSESVTRTMRYDTLGRMVVNIEPSSSKNGKAWHYAYNDAGDLVGTSDARRCGVNFDYDAAGRLLSEDYSPCDPDPDHQEPYDAAPEVEYRYDLPDDDAAVVGGQIATLGRMTAVTDRASKTLSHWDMLGRVTDVAKKLAAPEGSLTTDQWFHKHVDFDGAGRPVRETTGAMANAPSQDASAVLTWYTARGKIKQVSSTYSTRPLVERIKRNAEGSTTEITYGDAANTTTAFLLDELRRARSVTTYRAKPDIWSATPTPEELYSHQLLLSDVQFTYDRASNPVEIRDWRVANEWPAGAKPVTRKMQYDDLYRLTRIDYQSSDGPDLWVDPYKAETAADPSLEKANPSPRADFGPTGSRVMRQTFSYDWKGNLVETDDDQHAFFDRSIGKTQDDVYQLKTATNTSKGGDRTGNLTADYDAAGNLTSLTVHRKGQCVPVGKCNDQHFEYVWDEVGRLADARRWDVVDWQSADHPDAHLKYAYDAGDMRARKTVVDDATGDERHSLYVFGSLDIRLASHSVDENGNGTYDVSTRTEVPYLIANGVRLGRVVYVSEPGATDPSTRVFLELGDHLGSTSIVLDLATGELVERSTAFAYGGIDSDYRPSRWESFREEYRFTGKEDDVELGLVYFGKRYYAPALGRWISADPLTVHVPGRGGLNAYAYVDGRVLSAVDPAGLNPMLVGAAIGVGMYVGAQFANAIFFQRPMDMSLRSLAGAAIGGAVGGAVGGLVAGIGPVQAGVGVSGGGAGVGLGVGMTGPAVQAALGGAAGGAANALITGKNVAQGAILGAASGVALDNDFGNAPGLGGADAAAAGGAVGPVSFGNATAGETIALASLGGHLGAAWGPVGGTGAEAGAFGGWVNGAFSGSRGIYNWRSPSGYLAFGADSTWGILGTTMGAGVNLINAFAGAKYESRRSSRQNRHVWSNGFCVRSSSAFTQGNVESNVGAGDSDVNPTTVNHESTHVLQSRVFGKYFQYTYAEWLFGMGIVAGGAGAAVLKSPGSFETWGYYNNPWELWAYGANNPGAYDPPDEFQGLLDNVK